MAGIAVGVMAGYGTGMAGDGMHTGDGTGIAAPAIGAPTIMGPIIIGPISIMGGGSMYRDFAGGAFMADRDSAADGSVLSDRSAVALAVFAAAASEVPGPVVFVAVEVGVSEGGGDAGRPLRRARGSGD